jgi:molecular chaperone IbpA
METSFMKQEGERCALRAYSRVASALNATVVCNEKSFNVRYLLTEAGGLARHASATISKDAQALWLRTVRSGHLADHRMSLNNGGYAMRTFDLAPLYRSTVGFDRLFSMLDGFESAPGYPPYNIERTGENDYRVTVAVAGFGEKELSIEVKENTLTIKGNKQVKEEQNGEVLYQGIAARAFERVFQLADHVQVKSASLENGLLHVDLVREIPEAKKPRQIPIGNDKAKAEIIETKAA